MNQSQIHQNEIKKTINNNQKVFYGQFNFNQIPGDYLIETKDKTYQTKIIGKTKHYLVTDQNEIINISDCISIKKSN